MIAKKLPLLLLALSLTTYSFSQDIILADSIAAAKAAAQAAAMADSIAAAEAAAASGAAGATENPAPEPSSGGPQIHGNFQTDVQYYNVDSAIGAFPVPEKMLMNGFANINYSYGAFNAGIRYESYLNALQGFDPKYKGTGIPYRFASYKWEEMEVTIGNFYEQFGSGLILRAYEERGLGYDNALDGFRVKYSPYKGIYFKGLVGKQRSFFSQGPGVVRGFDGELNVMEAFFDSIKKTQIIVGGSFVSKFQSDQDPIYVLPENVGCYGGRINVIHGGFNLYGEYAYKINDPSNDNNFIYKNGEALFVTASIAAKGFAFTLSGKRSDNMSYRSDRTATISSLFINYVPTISKAHTYGLMAFYPYASQPVGEMCFASELQYKVPKGSAIGGKYGMDILLNFSTAYGLDTTRLNPAEDSARIGYTSEFFGMGNKYFEDINIEIQKKFSKKLKATLVLSNQFYNKSVIQKPGYPNIMSSIGVLDITYKIRPDKAIRVELQGMLTKLDESHLDSALQEEPHEDASDWAYALVEYTHGEHWFVAALDQYNMNPDSSFKSIHYPTFTVGYVKNATRITLSYGKQRAGIFCVGGVCRTIPASNGIALTITSSF